MTKDAVYQEAYFDAAVDVGETSMSEIMAECARRGMSPPFIITLVSRNGTIVSMRGTTLHGSDLEPLAEHREGGEGFVMPIHILIIDPDDQVMSVTLEAGEITYH